MSKENEKTAVTKWDSMTVEERNIYINQDVGCVNITSAHITTFSCMPDDFDPDKIDGGACDEFVNVVSHFSDEAHFECLTKQQNRILNMFYFEGMTRKKIADELGKPEGAIKGLLERAKIKLCAEFAINRG